MESSAVSSDPVPRLDLGETETTVQCCEHGETKIAGVAAGASRRWPACRASRPYGSFSSRKAARGVGSISGNWLGSDPSGQPPRHCRSRSTSTIMSRQALGG
ncbi:MAG: hypothetical protein ACR2MP_03940 [Streptosporangiaceae bacterium]